MNKLSVNSAAVKFFFLFARLEYSLKATGFLIPNSPAAMADWRAFAASILEQFNRHHSQKLNSAVSYILENHPKKQVIRDGKLAWDDVQPESESELDLIFAYVRRIRNNLFHGGKFRGGYFEAPLRAGSLIQHATTILEHCLCLSSDVREAFGE